MLVYRLNHLLENKAQILEVGLLLLQSWITFEVYH